MDRVTGTAEALLAAYENQLRGLVPPDVPWGAVIELDGPLVRTHYGTHGTVDHTDLTGLSRGDLVGLIRRQRELFAARREPVEWKIHSHDTPLLADSLRAAGFEPGPERALLAAHIDDVPPPGPLRPGTRTSWGLYGGRRQRQWLSCMAAAAPEQRRALAELEADGTARPSGSEMGIMVLEHEGQPLDALWIERVGGTDFAAIGGITGPRPELLHAAAAWASRRSFPYALPRHTPRFLVAEAAGALVPLYTGAGFHEIARVSTFRWTPPGAPARDRPAKQLLDDPEHDAIWQRFEARFEVTYKMYLATGRGIAEPPASATWHLAAISRPDDPVLEDVEEVIARGLRACARSGDLLYRLKWCISGARSDPNRVGRQGQPRWANYAYLVDEPVIQVTHDLRMGTFGNPQEASLCVFGDELLAHVDQELTDLLGTVLRRGGRPVGNVWSFGP